MQVALSEAMDAKLTKEGEVSVLRKNIEKVGHWNLLHYCAEI